MVVKDIANILQELNSPEYQKIGIYWDRCYHFFYSHRSAKISAEEKAEACSCLNDYLLKFGMKSRNAYFVKYGNKDFEPIDDAVNENPDGFSIDFRNPEKLIKLYNVISDSIIRSAATKSSGGRIRKPSCTAVTKVMMGVYGNIPAFDSRFVDSFKCLSCRSGINPRFNGLFTVHNLNIIKKFYEDNKPEIDKIAGKPIQCVNKTDITYTISRLIDCYGWH